MVYLANTTNFQRSNESKLEEISKYAQVYIFDLNQTIAGVEGGVIPEILEKLEKLSQTKKIVITSGWDYNGLKERFLDLLGDNFKKENLYFAPSNGSRLIKFNKNGEIQENIYEYTFSKEEEEIFEEIIQEACKNLGFKNGKVYFRQTQITYTGIINSENLTEKEFEEIKKNWDKNKEKRKVIEKEIKRIITNKGIDLDNYNISINGSTSIDINKKDENKEIITKAKAIKKLAQILDLDFHEMVYIGDGMGKGENDSFAREIPMLNVIEVDGKVIRNGNKTIIPDTLEVVQELIKNIMHKTS